MQITIELPSDLEKDLIHQANHAKIPLQTLILQALRQSTPTSDSTAAQWSDLVLAYEGTPDFPAFESYRDELLAPSEPEL